MAECKERGEDGSGWQELPPFLCKRALQIAVQKELEDKGLYALGNISPAEKVCIIIHENKIIFVSV